MNLDDYNIHVIASVFKQWLRDLPNPLMTFELYEEFIRAMGEWSSGAAHYNNALLQRAEDVFVCCCCCW